jgi:hypothetical protein
MQRRVTFAASAAKRVAAAGSARDARANLAVVEGGVDDAALGDGERGEVQQRARIAGEDAGRAVAAMNPANVRA